jgi:predicted nucleic acid-binding protein
VIAVDVNVIAYLLIAGEKSAEAQALRATDPDWVMPDLWRDEFLNILATYVRQGGTELDTAKKLWQATVELFSSKEAPADSLLALELAHRHRISAYDAQYLAVAVKAGIKLVTEDKNLRQSAPQYCATMREFLEAHQRPSAGE